MDDTTLITVLLGTGGTIAGVASGLGYLAAQLRVEELIAAAPGLVSVPLACEQVAQIDSKDMDNATWQTLARRVEHHLLRGDVGGIVITHGTDTLEETAYFLHHLLAPTKPVVLTAAMRPATDARADGPKNLFDAVTVVRSGLVPGVSVVMAGEVFHPVGLHKAHTRRLNAFAAGDQGPLARFHQGQLLRLRALTQFESASVGLGLERVALDASRWPRVDVVLNHAGADGCVVDSLLARGVQGLVLAGTGAGTQSESLSQALQRARLAGVRVVRASRCASGPVHAQDGELSCDVSGELTAVQARVRLLLELLAQAV